MGKVPTEADACGHCMDPDYFAVRRFRAETPILPFSHPLTADRDGWIAQRLQSAASVLEIGVGDRPFSTDLERCGFKGVFRTMDVANVPCDYRSLGDIREQFDGVVMREVVEHLPRELFYEYVDRIRSKLLTPHGILAITTPNTWAPQWYLCDFTHISPWPPADLYSILRYYGFSKVEIVRVIWPSKLLFLKRLYWSIHSHFYDVDFAGSYIALATL